MIDIFSKNLSNLKETSIDKHNDGDKRYLTESLLPAVNFDQVKESYCKNLSLSEVPASVDALYTKTDGHPVMIEFKAGVLNAAKQYQLRKKVYDSIIMYTDIVKTSVSETRKKLDLIVVYDGQKNSYDKIADAVSDCAGEEIIRFDLKKFKTYCFREIHTYTEGEFQKIFVVEEEKRNQQEK